MPELLGNETLTNISIVVSIIVMIHFLLSDGGPFWSPWGLFALGIFIANTAALIEKTIGLEHLNSVALLVIKSVGVLMALTGIFKMLRQRFTKDDKSAPDTTEHR